MLLADQGDDEEEWQSEDFCVRLLCENEEVTAYMHTILKFDYNRKNVCVVVVILQCLKPTNINSHTNEFFQGWHLVPQQLSLFTNTAEEIINTITDAAPFLARFYAILKQSSVKLKCLNGKLGESFMNYLDQVSNNVPIHYVQLRRREGGSKKCYLDFHLNMKQRITDKIPEYSFKTSQTFIFSILGSFMLPAEHGRHIRDHFVMCLSFHLCRWNRTNKAL